MENVVKAIEPYLPYVAGALPFIFGIIALAVNGRLKGFAQETVSAVYRVALAAANELQDEGLAWLRSDAGVQYRKELAGRAYDLLPARLGVVPVGIIKAFVTRDAWCALVEQAFTEMANLAERLDLPEELPRIEALGN